MEATTRVLQGLDSQEHQEWKKHRDALQAIPVGDVGFRGCLGVGLMVDATTSDSWLEYGGRMFLPNETVRFAFMCDIPLRERNEFARREAHWASLRQADCCFGMPILRRQGEDYEGWDFRAVPHDTIGVDGQELKPRRRSPLILPPDRQQEFRLFNAMELAMTTTAFTFRQAWSQHRKKVDLPEGMVFGQGVSWDLAENPEAWMPRAYLCFPAELRHELFDRSVQLRPDGPTEVPDGLLWEFCKALVADSEGLCLPYRAPTEGKLLKVERGDYHGLPCAALHLQMPTGVEVVRFHRTAAITLATGSTFVTGQVLAYERLSVPERFTLDRTLGQMRSQLLPHVFKTRLLANMRIWFERQLLPLCQDCVHVDSRLAARAALGAAMPEGLYWDVSTSQHYYNNSADGFVFPPLHMPKWDAFRGNLPGDLIYDVTPPDGVLAGRQDRRRGTRAGKKHREAQEQKTERISLPPIAKKAMVATSEQPRTGKKKKKKVRALVTAETVRQPDVTQDTMVTFNDAEAESLALSKLASEVAERHRQRTGTPTYPDLPDDELDALYRMSASE